MKLIRAGAVAAGVALALLASQVPVTDGSVLLPHAAVELATGLR